jgi:inosose dehydratase
LAAGGGAALAFVPSGLFLAGRSLPNPIGCSAISWRDQEFPSALKTIAALGFQGVQMLDWVTHANQGELAGELAHQLAELKLQPVILSAHKLTLDPARPEDEATKLRTDAEFFQKLGGHYLQVTDGGDPDRHYSRDVMASFGERLNHLGEVAGEYGLELGYHPHDRTLGETREGLGQVLAGTDPARVKLIADVAHLALGGSDPAEVIRTYHQRLIAVHFKDVRRQVLELARRDHNLERSTEFRFCEVGQGALDFPAILDVFREVRFQGWVIFELDSYEPRAGGPRTSVEMNRDAARRLGFRI